MSALDDIAAERRRQVQVEGWTAAHDDEYRFGKLAAAAACYALSATRRDGGDELPPFWPFAPEWWKPKNRRRDLVRAGALIVAEIERLNRAEEASTGGGK